MKLKTTPPSLAVETSLTARPAPRRPARWLLPLIVALSCGVALRGQAQTQIPATFVLPSASADASQPGFILRVHQVASPQPNENSRSERQLAGLLGDDVANPAAFGPAIAPASPPSSPTAPIRFDLPGVLNLSLFGSENAGNFIPDDPIPGLPGTTGSTENVAGEILAWLDLPAGIITMGVNSDDGFRATLGGANPIDKFAPIVGEYNGGRGSSDTLFSFSVAKAGLHAFRCTWEQGGGGANIEIFTVQTNGTKVLLNDAVHGGIRAYRAVTSPARAYARRVSPAPNSTGAGALASIVVELVDGASPIVATTATLSLDGVTVPVSRSKAGNVTTVTSAPPSFYTAGSQHAVVFSYKESGALVKVPWTFTVVNDIGPNGHVYEVVLVESGITWPDAKAAAERRGVNGTVSHLATITSYEEDLFLEMLRQSSKPDHEDRQLWVGGYQQKDSPDYFEPFGGWAWLNNEGPFDGFNWGYPYGTYANWLNNQPDNAYTDRGGSEDYLAIGLFDSFGWNDDGFYGAGRQDGTLGGYIVEYEPVALKVDIKPGEPTNTVSLLSNGKLPVAVLSTATFNATLLDVASIRFGRTGTEAVPVSSSKADLNGDGKKDLLLHFNVQDTELICDDQEAVLTALTSARQPAQGRDKILVTDCPHYKLTATALQDVNKRTDLELVVQPLKIGAITPALASQIQLKASDAVGKLRWTKNYQNVPLEQWAPDYSAVNLQPVNVLPHEPIKVKMLVPYGPSHITEVIYGETVVERRPDLALERIDAPTLSLNHQLISIPAYIRELNGDLGATADVYLMEGDNVIDVALNVSVPAHKSVAVVFSAIFAEAGTHAVKSVIRNIDPGDYDVSNNEKGATVEVSPIQAVDYYLNYSQSRTDYRDQVTTPYTITSSAYSDNYEYFYENIYASKGVGFPLASVQFRVFADGASQPAVDLVVHDVPASYSYDYGDGPTEVASVDLGSGYQVDITSHRGLYAGSEYTSATISHYASDYVVFSSYHDLITGNDSNTMEEFKSGSLINAASQIKTQFTVSGPFRTVGGSASMGLTASPFNNTWDYQYDFEDGNFEHHEGYYRGTQAYGNSYGQTGP